LTKQLILAEENVKALQNEVKQLKIAEISRAQHWSTLEMLFSEEIKESPISVDTMDKAVQVKYGMFNTLKLINQLSNKYYKSVSETKDQQTFTEDPQTDVPEILAEPASRQQSPKELLTKSSQTQTADSERTSSVEVDQYSQKSLESQLKQAMALASTRSTLLLETENRVAEYQGRIKTLEKTIEEQENAMKSGKDKQAGGSNGTEKTGDNILSVGGVFWVK
jgi:centrosomal protein CEP290